MLHIERSQSRKKTRAGVYETLCPQHMLALNNNIKMVPTLQRAITPEIFYRICSNVNQVLIIAYQLTKFQAPSSNSFQEILLTSLKCQNLQRAKNFEKL